MCSGEPCKNCTPGTECDVAPYERCELDAVLGTANCSKTEILLEYYLRWKLRADERPDEYDVVFPLECTELDFCGKSNRMSFFISEFQKNSIFD